MARSPRAAAATIAIDRQGINQAEYLGVARPTGSIIPRNFEFALAVDAAAVRSGGARQLLAEAGYPNGFDAGDFYPFPSQESERRGDGRYLQAVGIRTRVRTLERATFIQQWTGRSCAASSWARPRPPATPRRASRRSSAEGGAYAYGVVPEIEELFQRQAREVDRKKREALLAQIQEMVRDRVMNLPVYEYPIFHGVGPRVEVSGVGLIKGWVYPAPFEEMRLKAQ